MNRKPGRRGSILKSTVTNGDETGDIPRMDEVTGPLRNRRVSFSAKNHIKEFTKDASTSSEMESSDSPMDMTMIGGHADEDSKETSMNFTGAVGPNTTFVVNQADAELNTVVPTNNPNTTFVVESYMDETYGNGVVRSEVDDVTSPVLAGGGLAQGLFAQPSVTTENLNMTTFSPQDMSMSVAMSPNSVLVADREHDMSMTMYAPDATMDASPAGGADMSLTFHNPRTSMRRSAMKNRQEKQLAKISEASELENTASISAAATALDVERSIVCNQTPSRHEMSMTVDHTNAGVVAYDVSGMDMTTVGSDPQFEVARQLSDMSVVQRSPGPNNSQRIFLKSDRCLEMSYTVLRDDHDEMNSPSEENELGMSMTMALSERTAHNDLEAVDMSMAAGDSIYAESSHVKFNAHPNKTRSVGNSCDMSMTAYHDSSFDGGTTRHPSLPSDSTRANDMSMTFAEPRASSEIPKEQPSQHAGGSHVNRRRSRVASNVKDSPKVRRNEEEEEKISNERTRLLRPRSVVNGVSMIVKDHEGLSKPEPTPVSTTGELPAKSKPTGPITKKPVPLPRNSAFGRFGLPKTPRRRLPETVTVKKLARRNSFKDKQTDEKQEQDLGASEGTDRKPVDTPTKRRRSIRLSTKKTEELTQPGRVRSSASNSGQVERANIPDKSTDSPRKMLRSSALSVQSPRRSQIHCDVASPRRSSRNLPATTIVTSTSSGVESAKSSESQPKPAPRRVQKPPSDLVVTEVPQPPLRTLVTEEKKSAEAIVTVPKPCQSTTRIEEECIAGASLSMKNSESKINHMKSLETSPNRPPGKRTSEAPMNDQKANFEETSSSSDQAVTSRVPHSIVKQRRLLSPKVAKIAYPEAETEMRATNQLNLTTGLGPGFESPVLPRDGKENISVYRADTSKMEISRVTLEMATTLEEHHVKPSEVSLFDRTSVRVEAINDDEPEEEQGLEDISMAFQDSNVQMDESAINASNLSSKALRHAAEPGAQISSHLSSRPEETEEVAVLESPVVDNCDQSTIIDEEDEKEGSVVGWLADKGLITNAQPLEDVNETTPLFDATTVQSTPTGPVKPVQVSKPTINSNPLPKTFQPQQTIFLRQPVPSTSRSNFSLMEPRSRRRTRGGLGALEPITILGSTFLGQPVAPPPHMLKKLAQVKSLVGVPKIKLLDDILVEAKNLSDECFAYVIRDLTGSVETSELDAAEQERKLLKLTAQSYNPTNKLDPMLLFSKTKLNMMDDILDQALSERQDN